MKLECVIKFCYLGDTLGAGGGADEAARAKVRFDWAKFKELSPILTACGASYHMKGEIFRSVSKVYWHMGLRHGQWRLRICRAWENRAFDGCVVCLWRSEMRSFTVFWVIRAWLRWWGMVEWGGLGMWNVMEIIGCWPVEMWWWQGWDVRVGAGRLGENVWRMIWMSWVYTLNGWCGYAEKPHIRKNIWP